MANRKKVNLNKLRGRRSELSRGGGNYTFGEGETKVYLLPPLPGDDDPFVEAGIHWRVGPQNKSGLCLSRLQNAVLEHPMFKKALGKKPVTEGCPVCESLTTATEEERRESKCKRQFYGAVIPVAFKPPKARKFIPLEPEVEAIRVGPQIWEGIVDVMLDEGIDPTDTDGAVLLIIKRTGTGMDTEYEVEADSKTLASPKPLTKSFLKMVEAAQGEEGLANHFGKLSRFYRSPDEWEALMGGVAVEVEEEDDGEDPFGDDEPAPKPKPKPKPKPQPAPEPEVEEEDGDDPFGDDDDDGEPDDFDFGGDGDEAQPKAEPEPKPEPKPKAKPKPKPAPEPEDGEDGDDDGFDMADEIARLKAKLAEKEAKKK